MPIPNVFHYQGKRLHAESVDLDALADQFGTPCYVYSRAGIERAWQAYDAAFGGTPHLVCYAVKANSNLAVLNILARLGSGFDIVSEGELERVLRAGGRPENIVFSGVGKRAREISVALERGIRCFNVESRAELERIEVIAKAEGVQAPISLRVNPDIDAQTHPYISTGLRENKFGIPLDEAKTLYYWALDSGVFNVQGVDCHIGSQITSLIPFEAAFKRIFELVDTLSSEGAKIKDLNVGGGLGITYRDEILPSLTEYVHCVLKLLSHRALTVLIEPGRSIVGNAGVLLTRVEYLKRNEARHFAVVDAAMNDFIRPALYDGWSKIQPVLLPARDVIEQIYDIVGPVCESSDFLGKKRRLALTPQALLAVMSCGAYGFVMSSNYNSRPRAAEIMVDEGQMHLVRRRETNAELFAHEFTLPEESR